MSLGANYDTEPEKLGLTRIGLTRIALIALVISRDHAVSKMSQHTRKAVATADPPTRKVTRKVTRK